MLVSLVLVYTNFMKSPIFGSFPLNLVHEPARYQLQDRHPPQDLLQLLPVDLPQLLPLLLPQYLL